MKGRRWFEVRSAALLVGPLILDVFIKPFELEPITDPLNQFDEDLTFIPKQPSRLKLEQAKISELHTLLPS